MRVALLFIIPLLYLSYSVNAIFQGRGGQHSNTILHPQEQLQANYTKKCVVCGMVMNEIEGLLAENKPEEAIMDEITERLCSKLPGDLKADCDDTVLEVPDLIQQIENKNSVSVVCVNKGYCDAPISNGPDMILAPNYVISLDLLPNMRWRAVCSNKQNAANLQTVIQAFESFFGNAAEEINDLGKVVNALYMPIEYALEIQGCAAAAKVDLGWLTIMNMLYELSQACTSIIAQSSTSGGGILHARNMDFGDGLWLTNHFKNMTFTAEFRRLGRTQFYSSSIAGFVGVVTGMRPKAFSFSVNGHPGGFSNITDFVKRYIADLKSKNASLVSLLGRATLAGATDYSTAVAKLTNAPIVVNSYFIVGGLSVGEGTVITRTPDGAQDVWSLDITDGRWFEVETNYDHWKSAPWFDNRIDYANEAMMAAGRNVTLQQILTQVLTQKPVLNLQTIYSTITSALTGVFSTYIRNCEYPCAE